MVWPLPPIEKLVDKVARSKLDFTEAFNQIGGCTISLPKTAFRTRRGTYLHVTMQFCDNNAVSTQLPERVLEEARDITAMCIDDDIPVGVSTSNEHYASICKILKNHRAEKLFFTRKKSKLFIEDDEPLELRRRYFLQNMSLLPTMKTVTAEQSRLSLLHLSPPWTPSLYHLG
jgi:hypothetical protein